MGAQQSSMRRRAGARRSDGARRAAGVGAGKGAAPEPAVSDRLLRAAAHTAAPRKRPSIPRSDQTLGAEAPATTAREAARQAVAGPREAPPAPEAELPAPEAEPPAPEAELPAPEAELRRLREELLRRDAELRAAREEAAEVGALREALLQRSAELAAARGDAAEARAQLRVAQEELCRVQRCALCAEAGAAEIALRGHPQEREAVPAEPTADVGVGHDSVEEQPSEPEPEEGEAEGGGSPDEEGGQCGNGAWVLAGAEEPGTDYAPGGYLAVTVGDRLRNGRYQVLAKLGWGATATVWVARDTRDDRTVALKVFMSDERVTAAAGHEIDMLTAVGHAHHWSLIPYPPDVLACAEQVLHIIEHFVEPGPHGAHSVMVLPLLGPNLARLFVGRECGIERTVVKAVTKQILRGLVYLHDVMKVAHCDLKPENIMLSTLDPIVLGEMQASLPAGMRPSDADVAAAEALLSGQELHAALARQYAVTVGDMGYARWTSEYYEPGTLGTTLEYRSPEGLLGCQQVGCATDIWAAACIVFEMLTGCFLFDPKVDGVPQGDVYHLQLLMQQLGPPPPCMARGPGVFVNNFFDQDGTFKFDEPEPLDFVARLTQDHGWDRVDAEEFSGFILPMLEYDPARRPRARDLLCHPWLEIPDGGETTESEQWSDGPEESG
eukprot:TRINITY_DN23014_c0_g1_i1.p1 TRINITY_DN23014_c0_g1~~TRINITY_DN23014_c0_g1_i1.p1  ORF type:complete len:692 (+),score=221.29 TRINITY_DN23014_c0_g1_i1:81-2078(+)